MGCGAAGCILKWRGDGQFSEFRVRKLKYVGFVASESFTEGVSEF